MLPKKRKLNFSIDLKIRIQTEGNGSRLMLILKWLGAFAILAIRLYQALHAATSKKGSF